MASIDESEFLYFLAVFNRPKQISRELENLWRDRLGMEAERAADLFVTAGYLQIASLGAAAGAVATRPQLAELCRAYSVPVSGTKDQMIGRLEPLAADRLAMLVGARKVFERTVLGNERVTWFFELEKARYVAALQRCLGKIAEGDYASAILEARLYDSMRVFSGYPKINIGLTDAQALSLLKRICAPDFARRYQIEPELEESTKLAAIAQTLLGTMPRDLYAGEEGRV